ncbi:dihydroorotase [Roseiarcus fermentans]|uniref:Dihydroorotase n=1 Tax=Roseiarcus fermentans TaxID=1473586 RepID=A0A366FJD5_9HYPH|nr:dihydroorotase [Roseiarcus fermentans]RBP14100.1 dihydroorotase [Roseiarcus fermentans]
MSAPPVALLNARLVDPERETEVRGGLLVRDGVIAAVGPAVNRDQIPEGARVVDCAGDVVAPGLVDMRAFVGEPGAEHRETIASLSAAAAAGGVTSVVVRPDASPPVDDPAMVDFILRRAGDDSKVRIFPSAALTKGLAGREIAEIGLLAEAGAILFSDGSRSVADAQTMRRAMTYARDFDALVAPVCEDASLKGEGVVAEGLRASWLGLPGVPREAETVALERDLRLVALTGPRYHAQMISNRLSIEAMRRARDAGCGATCGVSINSVSLNELDVGDYRTFLKLSPPLRGEDERMALVEALADGVIDVICSDHDPQDVETKRLPFAEAATGAIGVETMLSASLRLVTAGHLSLPRLIRAMTLRPAQILRLPVGRLCVGAPADLIRFDPDAPYVLDPADLHSRCRNTPFDAARLEGRVKLTLVAGLVANE